MFQPLAPLVTCITAVDFATVSWISKMFVFMGYFRGTGSSLSVSYVNGVPRQQLRMRLGWL